MVLSNKKLKQNLRAAVAESLTESVAETHPSNNDSTNPDPNPKPQSLKELLDSATQKPRLSKREKRRKTLSLQDSEAVNRSNNDNNLEENKEADTEGMNNNNNNNDKEKKKKKKRKRDGDEVIENVKTANKKKKKKKKKAAAKNMEEKKGVELGNGENGEQVVAETVKISDSQENGDVATKVYVGGIPYYSTEDDIRSYFESCGTVTEIDCMKFPESGKFRGIAIISFKTEAAAKRALAFDGADMGGLFLKIQTYKITRANKVSDFAPEIVEGYNRIYAGNLSWDITEDDLRNFFSDCSISSIRFGMDKETGEFRGYAHVDFSDSLSLTMALKLDQEIVCGRPVKISCAVPKKGAKTHSKSPINNKKSDSSGVVPEKEAETHSRSPPSKKTDSTGVSSGTGKKKRRTCYECGEPGHISSACPKKQAADPINSSAS